MPDRAAADDEDTTGRHSLEGTEDARDRLDPDPVEPQRTDRNDVRRAQPLGEAARVDAQLLELVARRLMAGTAALAVPARDAVHDRDVRAVFEDARHFMTEDCAGGAAAELLDIRAAEAAGEYVDEVAGTCRVGNLGEPGQPVRVEDDRAHATILGRVRGEAGTTYWCRFTLKETRRLVATPCPCGSPVLRARRNTASSCCRDEAG